MPSALTNFYCTSVPKKETKLPAAPNCHEHQVAKLSRDKVRRR